MSYLDELPRAVADLIRSCTIVEFGTVSSAGVPIDTSMIYFPSEGAQTLDVATGIGYPAKAERVRKNPKVGLLLEGCGPNEPVVSIAGMGAVRDTDLQANTQRYIVETGFQRISRVPWSIGQRAVWYYCKIMVEITPARIMWWDSHAAMDQPPQVWRAPANTAYPPSDPEPPGRVSAPVQWEQPPWQEAYRHATNREALMMLHRLPGVVTPEGIKPSAPPPGHLTLCDDEGFPLPIRAHDIELVEGGLRMRLPKVAPWRRSGKATLTYEGLETFVGEVTDEGEATFLKVERILPFHPIMANPPSMWDPSPDARAGLMSRLRQETERRGVPIPTIDPAEPQPTHGGRLRMRRIERLLREGGQPPFLDPDMEPWDSGKAYYAPL
jgi:hypothetical protein